MSEKAVHVGAPACFALELAIRPVCEAFGVWTGSGLGACYQVGSTLERADWRDVDIRLMMPDEVFAREFPNAGDHWEHDARWLLLTVAISEYLSKRTGLPIDFQFQPQTAANKRHTGKRNAIGIVFASNSSDGASTNPMSTGPADIEADRIRNLQWAPHPPPTPEHKLSVAPCKHSYWFGWDMRPRCVKCKQLKPIAHPPPTPEDR